MNALRRFVLGLAILALAGCETASNGPQTLKSAYRKDFRIGVALGANQVSGEDKLAAGIVLPNFNSTSPENVMKWALIQPMETNYDFGPADAYVNYGLSNHMFIVGHTLVWHSQAPAWVFRGPDGRRLGTNEADRALLLQRMHDHITTIVSRYKGKIKVWDVVNETIADDNTGNLRTTVPRTPDEWTRILGTNDYDFIAKAFIWAHEADPDCILRYNDYNLDTKPGKRAGAIKMIKTLKAQGVPIMAIGLQGHGNLNEPTVEQEDDTLRDFSQLNLQIMVTELDIDCSSRGQRTTGADVNQNTPASQERTPPGFLTPAQQEQLAKRYSDLFRVFLKYRKKYVKLVTFWGVDDEVSWRRNGNPLLWDRAGKPKLAFQAVVDAAHGKFMPDVSDNAPAPTKTAMVGQP